MEELSTEDKNNPVFISLKRYLAALALTKGLIFWYAIEKVFYAHEGIPLKQIVLIGAVEQGAKVVFELPTSVVADRWSRRNLLLLANLSMVLCCIFLGFGTSFTVFMIGAMLWALSDALSSGVYEAFTYDSVATYNSMQRFKRIYSRMLSLELIALAVTGIIAGLLTASFGFRINFFISILPMLASSLFLLKMAEPYIHRTIEDDMTWVKHIHGTFALMRQARLRWPIALFISYIGLRSIWYEYYQLVGVDLHMTPLLFGMLFTIILVGVALTVELVRHLSASRLVLGITWAILIVTQLAGLRVSNIWFAVCNIVLLFMSLRCLEFYLELYIQNNITSDRRATVLSLASTVGYAWFFVLIGVFSVSVDHFGTRWALTIVGLPLIAMALIDLMRAIPWADKKLIAAEVNNEQFD